MLSAELFETAWSANESSFPIVRTMRFTPEGIVLGAGTVLASAGSELDQPAVQPDPRKSRLLALLSAAYGRPIDNGALAHIGRATVRWNNGEHDLAGVHLALTGLGELTPPRDAARRLFAADMLMEAGADPDFILRAMELHGRAAEDALKFYSPAQPRVPPGSGPTSGQWTRIGQFLLNALSGPAARGLARLAIMFPGPAVFLGVLFIPTNRNLRVQGQVPGYPGLRYVRYEDETDLHFFYRGKDGREREVLARLATGGLLKDPNGKVVGRVLPGERIAIDLAAACPKETHPDDKPRLCPRPTPDKFGQGEDSIARAYEDFVKRFVNPDPRETTPSGNNQTEESGSGFAISTVYTAFGGLQVSDSIH